MASTEGKAREGVSEGVDTNIRSVSWFDGGVRLIDQRDVGKLPAHHSRAIASEPGSAATSDSCLYIISAPQLPKNNP